MPSDIGGIPIHPLVVHAVVVLLPLAALGVFLLAVVPRWRKTFAPLVLGITLVATVFVPVATQSGEQLEEAVGDSELVEEHAEVGELVIWFALALLVVSIALWWLGRQERAGRGVGRGLSVAVSVLAVVVAAAASVQIVLVGHSGAESVWSGASSSSGDGGDEED